MTVNEFKLPDVGEGLTEAEIVTWLVKVGDTIKVNDIICEIETAKSLVELPSPYAGTVSRLMVAAGEMVAVGTPIISVSSGADAGRPLDAAEPADVETPAADLAVEPGMIGSPAPKADGATPTLVGYGPRAAVTTRRARKAAATGSPAAEVQAPPAQDPALVAAEPTAPEPTAADLQVTAGGAKALAKPPVRKLAKDLGVDLALVTPTGPGDTISRDDVEAFASAAASGVEDTATSATLPAATGQRETRVPIKGVRKMTAQAMVASAFTAPHVTEWVTFDATKSMRLVNRLREDRAFKDVRVSPLLLVARAVCLAARRTPEINSTWDESAQEIVLKHYVNLGIAAATPRGLVVPNIKDAESMSAVELAAALSELTSVARSGKTQPAEMAGGTFTITNVGVFGVDAGTPIINPGESAILAMGAIRKQPWVVGNKIRPRWVTTLALSFDHRVVDGQQGSQFLADVASILESPGKALIF
jgi:pyruvate dehydrogenase E2 component (dihydrolipoamide acetyltransferase)